MTVNNQDNRDQDNQDQDNATLANKEASVEEENPIDYENQFLYPSIEPHYRNDVK